MTPRRLSRSSSTWVLAGGLGVAAAVLAAVLGLLAVERDRAVAAQRERNALYARVLEDHVTRSVETVALALGTLGTSLADEPGLTAQVPADLTRMLGSLPQVRSLALLDASGLVLASSHPRDVDLRIVVERLGAKPVPGQAVLGRHVLGRGLANLTAQPGAPTPPGVGFIPLVHAFQFRGGQPALLVALLNPEGLATQMRLTLNDASSRALLSSYDGVVLVASDPGGADPGESLAAMPVFVQHLPGAEHASYVGPGVLPGPQVVAYRVSRTRPLVVIVERPEAAVVAAWLDAARWRLVIGAGAALLIAGLSVTAARSLRARELARLRLDEAQAEVARNERELNIIVTSVQELLFRTDPAGRLTFVNARWAAASGQDAEWALGRPLSSMVRPEEREAVRALFAGATPRAADDARTAHATLWSGTARPRRYDIAVVPLTRDGATVGFAGSAVDVTERREAEERLHDQLAFTERLLEISPLPTAMFDTQGRYLSVNRAWETYTGRLRAQLIGRPRASFIAADEALRHEAHDRELLAHGGSVRYEVPYLHPDGTRRDLLMSKVVVPARDGRTAGILCVFLDVSELRDAERATREARDAAEEASRAKSEFIANISHELRTPLQSIIGFSELGTVRGRDQPRLAGMFADIHASGTRMLALVNDLLDVSRLDSAVGTMHLERTDLRPLAREVLRELEPLLVGRQLHVEADISTQPLVARVDPLRFQQVLRNVLANAIKFSPVGSGIGLVGQALATGEIHFAVRDRGPGIPEGEVEKIFEAFVQSSTTKDGSGGTGLGLAICRKIIAAHGGRIHAENLPGGGSCFHIHLPSRGFADTQPAALDLVG